MIAERAQYATLRCPVVGCAWSVSAPQAPADSPSTFLTLLCAAEVISHVVGGYGAEGRRPHAPEEVEAVGMDAILLAAFSPYVVVMEA